MEQVVDRGALHVALVEVTVTSQVVGYLRKLHSGEILDSVELDLPAQTLPTRAVQYTLTPEALAAVGVTDVNLPGALHAAEHAMIGMLPLVATCDRWDIGGLSTNIHPDTGLPTVFVTTAIPAVRVSPTAAMRRLASGWPPRVRRCRRAGAKGCPSCVQSPKCGNGNEPLDKSRAIAVLELIGRLLG